jgi:hypothetical protein
MSQQTQSYMDEDRIIVDPDIMEAANLLLHFANTARHSEPDIVEGAILYTHMASKVNQLDDEELEVPFKEEDKIKRSYRSRVSQLADPPRYYGNLLGDFSERGLGYGRG